MESAEDSSGPAVVLACAADQEAVMGAVGASEDLVDLVATFAVEGGRLPTGFETIVVAVDPMVDTIPAEDHSTVSRHDQY